jgi:hypothetical protein
MKEQKQNFIDKFRESRGNITEACNEIKITRPTFRQWYKEDIDFKTAVDDINEEVVDFVESKMLEKINGVECVKGTKTYTAPPDTSSIIAFMKAKGKQRGYTTKEPKQEENTVEWIIEDADENNQ